MASKVGTTWITLFDDLSVSPSNFLNNFWQTLEKNFGSTRKEIFHRKCIHSIAPNPPYYWKGPQDVRHGRQMP